MRFLITQNKFKMRRYRVEPIEWFIAKFFLKKSKLSFIFFFPVFSALLTPNKHLSPSNDTKIRSIWSRNEKNIEKCLKINMCSTIDGSTLLKVY
jgi:hypothetical protein